MKPLSIIFYVLGVVLLLSALSVITTTTQTESIGYYIGTFFPALICLVIGRFFGGKVKSKTKVEREDI